jgi:hypothetical protein
VSAWWQRVGWCGFAVALAVSVCAESLGQSTSGSSGGLFSSLGFESPLNSSDPAIKAAAKAKAAKHKIHKKKGALKYLAGLGCVPERPEVAAAIVAAMGDPDEPVRYEAVKAVLQTAGNCMSDKQKKAMRKALGLHEACALAKDKCHKAVCDCIDVIFGKAPPPQHKHKLLEKLHGMLPGAKDECVDPATQEPEECSKRHGNCCTPEIRAKLQELAFGRDENGCFLERSERIRTAATQALKACDACAGGNCQGCEPCEGMAGNVREMPPAERREMPPGQAGTSSSAGSEVMTLPPCGCQPGMTSVLVQPSEEVLLWGDSLSSDEVVPLPAGESPAGPPDSAVEELPPLESILVPPEGVWQLPPASGLQPVPLPMSVPSPSLVLPLPPADARPMSVVPLPPAT